MFRSEYKVSVYVLILAVLAVGIGAFFAGYYFAGGVSEGDYIVSPAEEISVQYENETDEPDTYEEILEPDEVPTALAVYVYNPHTLRFEREALMRSMEDVQAVEHLLTRRYVTANTVDYGLFPEWELVPVEIGEDEDFQSPQDAYARLNRRIREYVEYVIQPGDTLHGIADAWRMDLQEFLRINGITEDLSLEPGERLWVVREGRLISVITADETWRLETLARHVERIYVTTLPTAHTRVVNEGRDGEIMVMTRTYREMGDVIYEYEFLGEVITPAVPRIIEVGI